MKGPVEFSSEGRMNTKSKRSKDVRRQYSTNPMPGPPGTLPGVMSYDAYRTNTTKEELCFEYIRSFLTQFDQLTGTNRSTKLLMYAENEFGVKKFVCSTIRPTELPFSELYDIYECASFLAGYILYEPLDPPNALPRFIFSPTQVLESHTGDCFDIAVVLCSLLIGNGYDAYVVSGYAPKYITLKDQSMTLCPMASSLSESSSTPSNATTASQAKNANASNASGEAAEDDTNNSYVAPDNSVKDSKFIDQEREKKRVAALDPFVLWIPEEMPADANIGTPRKPPSSPSSKSRPSNRYAKRKKANEEEDEDSKLRVHAWVVVLAGRRDFKEHSFIEPSTGRVYSVNNSPYIAIESVWNNTNYFVNVDSKKPVNEMEFDFLNTNNWEYLFMPTMRPNTNSHGDDLSDAHRHEHDDPTGVSSVPVGVSGGGGGGGGGIPNAPGTEKKKKLGGAGGAGADDSAAGTGKPPPNGYISNSTPGATTISLLNSANNTVIRTFDSPPTWVNPLIIDRRRFLMKYPPYGKRTIQYFKCKVDYFARGINSQQMVMRITQYLDIACTIVSEIHEWFENRKDKLYKRIRYFLNKSRYIEFYLPGSIGEVKQLTEYPGKMIHMDFYVNGRLDRLYHREEIFGQRVTENFEGRNDHLIFRSFQLTTDKSVAGARQFTLPGGTLAHELYILKMTQCYEPPKYNPISSHTNSAAEANAAASAASSSAAVKNEIAKRSFYVREGKAVVTYHFEQNKVTGKVKTYLHTKGPNVPGVSELAITQEVGIEEDPDLLQEAIALERECYTHIKVNFQQILTILMTRENAEQNIISELSVFDTALDKALADTSAQTMAATNASMASPAYGGSGTVASSNMSAGGADGRGTDYLLPFLRKLKDPSRITKEEALEIRQNCLDALKARLVERANIIQSRLNDENAKLGRKQEQFQRSQREGDLSTEEYESYCTKAMFRIQILEKRLVDHEEAAMKKFSELDNKLANDPRLRILKNL